MIELSGAGARSRIPSVRMTITGVRSGLERSTVGCRVASKSSLVGVTATEIARLAHRIADPPGYHRGLLPLGLIPGAHRIIE